MTVKVNKTHLFVPLPVSVKLSDFCGFCADPLSCLFLYLDVWIIAATPAFPLTVQLVFQRKKTKLHFTFWAVDLSWHDIIGLQSSFHCKFNAWHTSTWVGQACRWRWRWCCDSLLPIIVCGIYKGHLQEALDMTSFVSICSPWLLCGVNITDAFQTTEAAGHFSGKAAKVTHTHTGKNH